MSQLGDLGSGAGKGGGGGGSIREAGGAFGKAEAAKEEEYFYKKVSWHNTIFLLSVSSVFLQQREQLKELKTHLHDEIAFHEEQIKRHQEAIARHKEGVKKLENQ